MADWLLNAFKYLASFRKREWQLEDYPVRIFYQDASAGPGAYVGWVASIQKWWLAGTGPTKEAALRQLRENLAAAKREGDHPRPGTRPPIRFAPADKLALHGEFASKFVQQVTGTTPMLMSDGTSLTDFAHGEELEQVRRKVALLYGPAAAAMVEGPLWRLLDHVHARAEHRDAGEADEIRGD